MCSPGRRREGRKEGNGTVQYLHLEPCVPKHRRDQIHLIRIRQCGSSESGARWEGGYGTVPHVLVLRVQV